MKPGPLRVELHDGRDSATATLLPDGKVLVAAGLVGPVLPETLLRARKLYNPETGTWATTGSLGAARNSHTATLLSNGKVLVAGGTRLGAGSPECGILRSG